MRMVRGLPANVNTFVLASKSMEKIKRSNGEVFQCRKKKLKERKLKREMSYCFGERNRIERETEKEKERERDRESEKKKERERESEKERERKGKREKEKERKRERERKRR